MDMFFADPSEVPLPPDEVRIRELRADPYPDGRRVKIYLEVDPFQRRPNAELTISGPDGSELAAADIIESMQRKMELTMHLRRTEPGELTLSAVLYYARVPPPPDRPERPPDGAEANSPASSASPHAVPPPLLSGEGRGEVIQRTVVDTARIKITAGQ